MKMLSSQYAEFTREERLRLVLAAAAREDRPEVQRLLRSCPQMPLVGADPHFGLVMWVAVSRALRQWVEVSAFVLGTALLVDAPSRKGYASVAKATATWKKWSAAWRGIESGITKFCAEAGLTDNQLLVWADGRSAAVERARGLLHDDARADRLCEDATRQKLRRAWQGGNEP